MSDATLRVYYLRLRTLKFQSTHRVSDATIFDIFGSGNSKFQSTHRVSDATSSQRYQVYNPHISIHAPRERCDEVPATHRNVNTTLISIHAPRERCDVKNPKITKLSTGISIHAPRERCDTNSVFHVFISLIFQSTHRVSDATGACHIQLSSRKPFQSTHRVSDATSYYKSCSLVYNISIHAPRERCDGLVPYKHMRELYISIHAPRERCDAPICHIKKYLFISIHAPRERCDHFPLEWQQYFSIFQSTHRVSDATRGRI